MTLPISPQSRGKYSAYGVVCPGDLEIGMGSLDEYLDWPSKFKDINPQKARLMAYSHWKFACFAALNQMVCYMLIQILYITTKMMWCIVCWVRVIFTF